VYKKKKKNGISCVVLLLLVLLCTNYSTSTPHLSLDISWQGEWLAQKEEVEKRTDLSLFFFFLDFPFIIYLRMRPQKLLPLTFFFYSPDEKIGLKWHWSDFFFFFPIWKQWRNFNKIILFLLHQKNTCVLISLMFGSMFFQCV
jgi:hypothetical protein